MRNAVTVSTILTAASSYNLVDLTTVKTLLGITGTTFDAVLNIWIPQASTAAQNFTGNPFVVETLQDQIWPRRDGVPWTVRADLSSLLLTRWPVTTPVSPARTAPPIWTWTSNALTPLGVTAGGSLAAAAYNVALTYVTPYGETPIGPTATVACLASQIFTVPAPGEDGQDLATGYNVYAGLYGNALTKQASNIAIGNSWTLPTTGLVAGAATPNYVSVIEQIADVATPLGAGVDFTLDPVLGKLYRLDTYGNPKDWDPNPVVSTYSAGYATVPADVFDAVVTMVKQRWYAQTRDPMIRSENIDGVASTNYWFASGPGADTDMPADIQAKLERYRIPQFG